MNGAKLVSELERKLNTKTKRELQYLLGISHVMLLNWQRKTLTPRMVAGLIGKFVRSQLSGQSVINTLAAHFNTTKGELARNLGLSPQRLNKIKKLRAISAKQIVNIIKSASTAAQSALRQQAIRPLVEFFPVTKAGTGANRVKNYVFNPQDENRKAHPYLQGLKTELEKHSGIYIFYDSRGQAIYAGKARKQSIWKEMNAAFNRRRDSVQKIKRIKHPSRKQSYKTTEEKTRNIKERAVTLHELAAYFSAYKVEDGLIDEVESLLVRSFANDLLNKRMERFGQQRALSAARKTLSKNR